MPEPRTAAEAFTQIDEQIGTLSDARHRQMLSAFRTHWHGEVSGDLDAAMSVVREDSHFSVIGALPAGEAFAVTNASDHRAAYQVMPDHGLNAGGSFSNMRFAFADWGFTMEATYANVVYGEMLANIGDYDAQGFFLFHAPLVMVCMFDDDGKMYAKRDYFGGVKSVDPADLAVLQRLTALPVQN